MVRAIVSVDSRPVGLYIAIVTAAVATVVLLVAFGPVSETAFDAASALFA